MLLISKYHYNEWIVLAEESGIDRTIKLLRSSSGAGRLAAKNCTQRLVFRILAYPHLANLGRV